MKLFLACKAKRIDAPKMFPIEYKRLHGMLARWQIGSHRLFGGRQGEATSELSPMVSGDDIKGIYYKRYCLFQAYEVADGVKIDGEYQVGC